MRIALSVDALAHPRSGIGRYTWELALRLSRHREISRLVAFHGQSPVRIAASASFYEPAPATNATRARAYVERGRLAVSMRWPGTLAHGPNYFLPDHVRPGVVTVHDLSVLRFPETHPVERVRQFEARFEATLARARHVITDCETIREELIQWTGISPDLVTAVPLGVSGDFARALSSSDKELLDKLGLAPRSYGLCVSTFEPRKRIDRLIRAWRLLPDRLRKRHALVLAGSAGWRNTTLEIEIDRAEREGWLVRATGVDDDTLRALYAGAAVFAYPSLYEGFGLPPLEAMAAGVPVIVASGTCMTEVTKGAADIVEVEDEAAFAEAIARAIDDDGWRAKQISAGRQVAASYDWGTCADRSIDVYRKTLLLGH